MYELGSHSKFHSRAELADSRRDTVTDSRQPGAGRTEHSAHRTTRDREYRVSNTSE